MVILYCRTPSLIRAMGLCQSKSAEYSVSTPTTKPMLYYMPIAARGEVPRMIAKMGGLEIDETHEVTDAIKKDCGSPGSLPALAHGDLKISQSHAIVAYLLTIAPKFKNLTPGQRAKDLQLNAIMDDVMGELASKVLFNPQMKEDPAFAPTEIPKIAAKWLPILEGILPSEGFVNGLPYPTAADFAMVNLLKGFTPFAACWNMGKVEPGSKLKALVDRTAAVPEVKDWLATSKFLAGNPFGLPA